MPMANQYETVKQQCNAFRERGYHVLFDMQDMAHDAAPKVLIVSHIKTWRFCDPDWDVVTRQLATLYMKLKQRSHV